MQRSLLARVQELHEGGERERLAPGICPSGS
jgi:hypothetical protein